MDFEKWEACIGKIILACTRVEFELSRLYEAYLPERDFYKDDYSSRFNKAIGVARLKINNGDAIARMLIDMKKYLSIRHTVAHNPIHYLSKAERAIADDGCEFGIIDHKQGQEIITIKSVEYLSQRANVLSTALCVELRSNVALML